MSDAQATYGIAVNVTGADTAVNAAKALEDLKAQIAADNAAMREMQATMRALNQGSNVSIESFRTLRDAIAAKKVAVAGAADKLVGMKGAFEKAAPPVKELTAAVQGGGAGLESYLGTIKGAAGPMGGLLERVGALGKGLGKLGLAAVAIAAAAAVAVFSVAVIAATANLVAFGFEAAGAARDQALLLEAAQVSGGAIVESGDKLADVVNSVASQVPLATEEVTNLGAELARAGIQGDALAEAVEAVAIAKSAGEDVGKLTAQLKLGGAAAAKAADTVKKKFGPIVKAQMLSVGNQVKSVKKSFAALFSSFDIEPFLVQLKGITDLFSQSTSSGRALKSIIDAMFVVFKPIVETLGPIVQGFFKGLVIGALLVTIALLKVRNFFRDAFGDSTLAGLDLVNLAVGAGVFVIGAMAAILAVVAGAFAIFGAAVYGAWKIVQPFWEALKIGFALLSDLATFALNAGSAVIDGFINGFKSGASKAIQAVKDLAGDVMKSFKSTLGIASPSKVFEGFGVNIAAGAERGIDKGAPAVQGSADDMAPNPNAARQSSGRGAGGVSAPITINLTISGEAAKDPGLASSVKDQLAPVFEELAAMLGAKLEGAA